jgi:two-component system sensor histidine kinase KdpD
MLGHEMRTPLTVVIGNARLVRRWLDATGDARKADVAADLETEAERLHRLVEDLLVVSRGDTRLQIDPEPVLLQRVVPGVVGTAHRRYPQLRIATETPADLPPVAGDRTLIEQVLANLISNAAKYAGAAASVAIVAMPTANGVAVEVTDDGPGFPPGSIERAFDVFYRAPSTAAHARGAGVGLYVVRRLVEAMGGRVAAGNGPAGGAMVRFELPESTMDLEDAAGSTAPAASEGQTGNVVSPGAVGGARR